MKEEDMIPSDILEAITDVIFEELKVKVERNEYHLLPEVIRKALREGTTLRDAAWRKNTHSG